MTGTAFSDLIRRRTRLVAWLVAIPAIMTASGVLAVDALRALRPDSGLFTPPFVYSLADAIANDDVLAAYEFIRRGQNPNDLIAVRHPVLTNGRSVLVSPLLWAVAAQAPDSVRMLIAFGARMERQADKSAACLADALGNTRIASIVRLHGGEPPARCTDPSGAATPLLSILESP